MNVKFMNRAVGVLVIGAVSLVGTAGSASARQAPQEEPPAKQVQGQQKKQARQQQKKQAQPPAAEKQQKQPRTVASQPEAPPAAQKQQKQPRTVQSQPEAPPAAQEQKQPRTVQSQPEAPPVVEQQQKQPRVAATPQKQPRVAPKPKRLPPDRQQQLIDEQKQQVVQYRQHLDEQERIARERADALRQQNRLAHYRYQQQYYQRLRSQRARFDNPRYYNYTRDPYFYTAPSYRYTYGGTYYETNQYGMNLLRQAVNYGYQEGYRAGRADRQDRWGNGYEDSFAYQDANYGYPGLYVGQGTYNYYFREGFRRGYEDGYNSHYHYGRSSNGALIILASVLAGILVYEAID
jgi:hypothetical protein